MRCDLWSCGVILYILLAGYPPFRGDSDEDIFKSIESGSYNMDEPELKDVSKEAKTLIKKLLEYNPNKRLNAEQALKDPWIKNYAELPDKPLMNKTLVNMKNFRVNLSFLDSFLLRNIRLFLFIEIGSINFRLKEKFNWPHGASSRISFR